MRFCERDRRTVWLRRRRLRPDAYGEPVVDWEEAVPLRVCHQPVQGGFLRRAYGLCPEERRLLFYDGPEAVLEGDGICLRSAAGERPDYRAVAVAVWDGYQRIEVERLTGQGRETPERPDLRAPGELAPEGWSQAMEGWSQAIEGWGGAVAL